MTYYSMPQEADYVDNYRSRSMVIGKEIQVIFSDCTKKATAIDVDKDCRLIVEYENGTTESLYSGEISIKING